MLMDCDIVNLKLGQNQKSNQEITQSTGTVNHQIKNQRKEGIDRERTKRKRNIGEGEKSIEKERNEKGISGEEIKCYKVKVLQSESTKERNQ